MKSKPESFWVILCMILLLGAGLRLSGLTRQSLWLDEANGVRIAEKSFGEIITELKSDVSPPLHYFMLHIWMRMFGSGELSTRVFVSIFGILLLPAIYYVGSSLFNRRMGLISVFIASIAEYHIRYSQEVRMYSMLALFGLMSMYFIYKAVTANTRASWIGYTIFTLLTIYTHNYGLFIAAAGVVFFVICKAAHKANIKKLIISLGIVAILYLPWLPVFILKQYGSSAIVGWIPQMTPYHIYETFLIYSGLVFDVFSSAINKWLIMAGFILFICCFLAGIFSVKKYKSVFIPYIRNNPGLILLMCYLFVTLAIPMLVSIKKPIYLTGRYSISAWPAFPLILGLGISRIKNLYKFIMLGLILFFSSVSLYWYNYVYVKSYDRSIAGFIESNAGEGDLLVFAPSWAEIPVNYYLRKPFKYLGYPWKSTKEPPQEIQDSERKPEDMVKLAKSKMVNSPGKMFFICQESATWVNGIQNVGDLFDRNFKKIESQKYEDMKVTKYKVK